MIIVIGLNDLLSNNTLQDAGNNQLKVIYKDNDAVSIPDLQRILNSKVKLSFVQQPNFQNEIFEYGYLAGAFASTGEDVFWVVRSDHPMPAPITTDKGSHIFYYSSLAEAVRDCKKKNKGSRKKEASVEADDDDENSHTAPLINSDAGAVPSTPKADEPDDTSSVWQAPDDKADSSPDLDLSDVSEDEKAEVPDEPSAEVSSASDLKDDKKPDDTTGKGNDLDELDLGDDGDLDIAGADDEYDPDVDDQPDVGDDFGPDNEVDDPDYDFEEDDSGDDVEADEPADEEQDKSDDVQSNTDEVVAGYTEKPRRVMSEQECYADLRRMISKAGGMAADNYRVLLWTLQQSTDVDSWKMYMQAVIPNADTVKKIYTRLHTNYDAIKDLADQVSPVTIRRN